MSPPTWILKMVQPRGTESIGRTWCCEAVENMTWLLKEWIRLKSFAELQILSKILSNPVPIIVSNGLGQFFKGIMEPQCKKQKTRVLSTFTWEVTPVLSDEKLCEVELLEAFAAPIINKKQTSCLIKQLTCLYPLNNLPHIKRVRNCRDKSDHPLEIIICLLRDIPNREVSLNDLFPEAKADGLGEPFRVRIPAYQPLTRSQFEVASQHWPTTFRENKQVTDALQGHLFNTEEKTKMQTFMEKAIEAATVGKKMGMEPVGAVIVNPATDEVVAVGHDCRNGPNPLLHAVMVCIDLVAYSQGGGAFNHNKYHNCCFKAVESFPGEHAINIGKPLLPSNDDSLRGNIVNGLPYICTGYDLYVSREPCVMCAMALVHSRIRRVFYATSFPDGALGTKYKIHTKKDLNHHYDVFKGLMEDECQFLLS